MAYTRSSSVPATPTEAIAAIRAGDRARARMLLVANLQQNPADAMAWLWLSGALTDRAEQRYCLERALAADPTLAPAQRGLALLAEVVAQTPVEFQNREPRTAGGQTQDIASANSAAPTSASTTSADRRPAAERAPAPVIAAPPRLRAPSGAPATTQPTPSADPSVVYPQPSALSPQPFAAPQPSALSPQPFEAPHPSALSPQPFEAPHPSSLIPHPSEALPPSLAIWTQPRAAMRVAVAERTPWETGFLGALAGINLVLAWAAQRNLGDQARPAEIIGLAVVFGPFLGLGGLILGGVLLRSSGRWLGGRAGAGAVRAALAWAGAPLIVGLLLWLIQLVLLPTASFTSAAVAPAGALIAAFCGVVHAALLLWAVGLSLIGLAVAHEFSLVRAVLSWLLAGLFVAAVGCAVVFGTATLIGLRGG